MPYSGKRPSKTPEQRRRGKYTEYLASIGRPMMVTGDELAVLRVHLMTLKEAGMSCYGIAASAPGNHSETSVAKVVNQWTGSTHRDVYNDLLLARYEPPVKKNQGAIVEPCGTRRRMQALVADGWGFRVLGEIMGISGAAAWQLAITTAPARGATVLRVKETYDKLQGCDPMDHGSTKTGVSRAKSTARRKDWAPSHCWDADTIVDPNCGPEWTGRCGTTQGYRIHQRDHIPICADCRTAASLMHRFPQLGYLMGIQEREARGKYGRGHTKDDYS